MFAGLTDVFRQRRAPRSRAAVTIPQPKDLSARWGRSASAVPRHRVRVVGIERETADAITLLLEPVSGRPVPFCAGQYLTHCFEIDGATVKRAYSISVAEGNQPACTIKAIEGGVTSRFVAEHVEVGYQYTVIGPSGDFLLPAEASAPLAFLAAGSGITPVMALIGTALQANPDRVIELVYASRRQADIIFAARLAELEGKHSGFTITHVLSRPDRDWAGRRGRLDGEQAAKLLQAQPGAEVYLCGPEDLMAETAGALVADGFPAGRIHQERFYAAARHTTPLPTVPQPIEFRRSNLTIVAQPGETILEAGLRNGVKLDFSCTVGGCGACKVRMMSGAVSIDEPNCLTDAEKADGYTLGCSAYALEPAVIDA
ncbi:MAG TPA: ferredoxin--NADP reductase [Mycobacterium sp.]|nr:ferredoxin--NADP reductase [Mycobacterium sp.]